MTIEIIESPIKVSEKVTGLNPLEPKAVFLVQNGTGGEKETTLTLSSWEKAASSAIEERGEIKERQKRVREREQTMSKRKTTNVGKPYSSTERRQILSQIRDDTEKIDEMRRMNRRKRIALIGQGYWLLVSPPECPLKVRVKDTGENELVAGEPLNGGEAAWRMFLFRGRETLASHRLVRIVKEGFVLRRDISFRNEDEREEAKEKLNEFNSRILDAVPDDLVPIFKEISNFDFRKPLLSELETLRKEN